MFLFRSNRTKNLSKKMLGNMKPSEIVELVKDDQMRGSDVPRWVEAMIEEFCTILLQRFEFYEARYRNRFSDSTSLIEKMEAENPGSMGHTWYFYEMTTGEWEFTWDTWLKPSDINATEYGTRKLKSINVIKIIF